MQTYLKGSKMSDVVHNIKNGLVIAALFATNTACTVSNSFNGSLFGKVENNYYGVKSEPAPTDKEILQALKNSGGVLEIAHEDKRGLVSTDPILLNKHDDKAIVFSAIAGREDVNAVKIDMSDLYKSQKKSCAYNPGITKAIGIEYDGNGFKIDQNLLKAAEKLKNTSPKNYGEPNDNSTLFRPLFKAPNPNGKGSH